ncbi:hypothetical protein [Pedobacter sp. ASV28]|uniref:hypothetical protein n=1 Tax=Pedobacter sp. ASV28 TaxID=2795123 RepID=UPI001E61D523|nr:hypothetical protein [Pedobacter sp. ASV28]
MKKRIVFDLDGTLALSKSAIDAEMGGLLDRLLEVVKVAIISGGDWPQFQKQVIASLSGSEAFGNLSILPACGTKYYSYAQQWEKLYEEDFTTTEKKQIFYELNVAIIDNDLIPKQK